MAESILVTGKKISSMELVTNVQGNEKIPTGQPEDLAITPNQIKDFAIEQGDLVNQTELETEISQLQTSVTNTLNQAKSYTDTKVNAVSSALAEHLSDQSNPHQVTKEQVGLGQVDNTSDIAKPVSDATRILVDGNLNYIKENGAALPFSSTVTYIDRSVVIKDGKLMQKNGSSWEKIKTETASELPTANSQNQQEVNDIVGAKWYAKEGGYALNSRVMLGNGEIVRNVIANNVNNPNSNLDGWIYTETEPTTGSISSELDDLRTIAKVEFGFETKASLSVDSSGILKSATKDKNGVQTSESIVMPYTINTGKVVKTEVGSFAQKQLFLPSQDYEDVFQSPSLGISYTERGKTQPALISPIQSISGYPTYPDNGSKNITWWDIALSVDATPFKLNGSQDNDRYIEIAKWNKWNVGWGQQIEVVLYGSNTSDRFLNKTSLLCNYQALRTGLNNNANLNSAYLSKYFKVITNVPRNRQDNQVVDFGVSIESDYVVLYAIIPAGLNGVKAHLKYYGDESPFTIDTNSRVLTAQPAEFVKLAKGSEFNSINSAIANDSTIITGDFVVRVCNSLNSYTSRQEIAGDGFIWCGYGTFKTSGDLIPNIERVGVGVYRITNFAKGIGVNIREGFSNNGIRTTYSLLNDDGSDPNVKWLNVFKPKYELNTTTGELTISAGTAMDIPDGVWIDVIGYINF